MPDPIHDLDHFDTPGLPVNPLPASEVRRRGDRMRRRNNALATLGSIAAVAIVAVPLALSAHGDPSSAPGPAGPPTPAPGWVQQVPDSFDLTALPAGAGFSFTARDRSVVDDITLCGVPVFSTRSGDPVAPAVDTRGAVHGEAGTESSSGRTLALYPSDEVAAQALSALRRGVESCPEETRGAGAPLVHEVVPADLAADDSLVFTEQSRMDRDLLADLTVFQVARTGNALYLATGHTSAGGAQVVDAEVRRMAEQSAPVISDMCVFSATPCSSATASTDATAPATTGTGEGAASTIPADFPLQQGLLPTEGTPLDGPSATAEGVPALELCGATAWPTSGSVERLAVTAKVPQVRESRELVTFARAEDASAAVARVRDAVRGCPVVAGDRPADDRLVDEQPTVLPGSDETVTFSLTYREGLGGGVYQVTRVGRAVYATFLGSEFSRDSVPGAVEGLSARSGPVVASLCRWSDQGC